MPVQLKRKIAISQEGRTVTLEMVFPDPYSATVYRDDLVERIESGDGALISIAAPKQKGKVERRVA